MNRHGVALLALSILAIAGWAYSVNYKTMTALDRLSGLRSEIAKEREALQVLRVEWAYLNAPERLERLLNAHNDTLSLAPMQPYHLKHVAVVPFPDGDPREADGEAGDPVSLVPIPTIRPIDWTPE